MEYISIHDISDKWNMKERKVTALCRDGRIAGAKKMGKTWMVPSDALMPLDMRTKEFDSYNKELIEEFNSIPYLESSIDNKVVNDFKNIYKKNPDYTSFVPYRLCLLGINYDFNKGKVLGVTLDKGIHMAYSIKLNGIIELISLQYPKRAQWHVLEPPTNILEDWADPLRIAATELNKRYPLRLGICAVIDGELPLDGLSSSNTLILTFLSALAFVNNIKLSFEELIEISRLSEKANKIITNTKLDSMIELYSKKNHILYLDMKDDSSQLIPETKSNYDICVIFTGLNGDYNPSIYNTRTDELRSVSYLIKGFENESYSSLKESNLRDISYDSFMKYKNKLPNNFVNRAEHWYFENDRVDKGDAALKDNDVKLLGKLMTESGESSIKYWETGSNEVITLFNIIKNIDGVYGTRFSGTGFKGCCIALVDSKKTKEFLKKVEDEYCSKFPKLKNKYSAHICHSADGVKL